MTNAFVLCEKGRVLGNEKKNTKSFIILTRMTGHKKKFQHWHSRHLGIHAVHTHVRRLGRYLVYGKYNDVYGCGFVAILLCARRLSDAAGR